MGYRESDRTGARHPMLEVKRVTLEDGLHASLILENGRICKLVSPSGEVAVLKWEGDQSSPRPPPASSSQADQLRRAALLAPPCLPGCPSQGSILIQQIVSGRSNTQLPGGQDL